MRKKKIHKLLYQLPKHKLNWSSWLTVIRSCQKADNFLITTNATSQTNKYQELTKWSTSLTSLACVWEASLKTLDFSVGRQIFCTYNIQLSPAFTMFTKHGYSLLLKLFKVQKMYFPAEKMYTTYTFYVKVQKLNSYGYHSINKEWYNVVPFFMNVYWKGNHGPLKQSSNKINK